MKILEMKNKILSNFSDIYFVNIYTCEWALKKTPTITIDVKI